MTTAFYEEIRHGVSTVVITGSRWTFPCCFEVDTGTRMETPIRYFDSSVMPNTERMAEEMSGALVSTGVLRAEAQRRS